MPTTDYARDESDKRLKVLEKEIYALYKEAADGLEKTIKEYFGSFQKRDAEMQERLKAGEITEEYYKQWRLNQITRGKRFEALRDKVAERMTNINEVAAAYINDRTPGIYSLSANYAAYTIEQLYGQTDFTLWNEQAVRRLAVEKPEVMPYYPPERAVERGIDLAWGQKQIKAVVTSSILRGQSLKGMVSDLMERIPTMERASAIRAARTAFTSAENGGRQATFERAAEMGIQARKRWVATKDKLTRRDHANADGQTVPIDQPFDIGGYAMMYPGDPDGPGKEVYSCRCGLRTVEGDDIEAEPRQMRVRDPKTGRNVLVNEMTYAEWESWKETGILPARKNDKFVAKSAEEAEEYAKKNIFSGYLGAKTSYNGVNVDIANKINSTLYDLVNDYKINPSGLEFVTSKTASGKKKLGGNSDALFATNPLSGTLYGNRDIFKSKESFEKNIKASNDAFSYVMRNKSKLSGNQKSLAELYEKAGKSLVNETVEGMITHEYGHLLSAKINPTRETLALIKENMKYHVISGYSQHNVSEYLAECFVEYTLGDKSKLDKNVVSLFDGARRK